LFDQYQCPHMVSVKFFASRDRRAL
jgi:hypothetical protein